MLLTIPCVDCAVGLDYFCFAPLRTSNSNYPADRGREHRNQLPVVRQFPQNENILLESAVRFGHFQFYAGQFDGLN